jgi:superfamily I DNA/RNA helicase
MPLIAKTLEDFEYPHEERGFKELAEILRPQFEGSDRDVWLLGNLMCNGLELDALLIKNDTITVIELKSYSGHISAGENGPWFANGHIEVKGGSNENPFRQVRKYRIGLIKRLGQLFKCSEKTRKPGLNFGHISGLVYFQQEIQLKSTLPSTVSLWFSIACPSTIASVVTARSSKQLNLGKTQVDDVLKLLGASKPNTHGTKPATPPPVLVNEEKRVRYVTVRGLGFSESLVRLKSEGGSAGNTAREFDQIYQRIRQTQPVFDSYSFETTNLINNGILFELGPGYRLIVIKTQEVNYICYLGSDRDVDQWLEQHSGMLLTFDAHTGEVKKTYSRPKPTIEGHSAIANPKPYLKQLNNLDLRDFIDDEALIERLENVTDNTDPKDYKILLLELQIKDADVAKDLEELITLLRNNEFYAAEARVNLIYGVAIPVEDAGDLQVEAIDEQANSETLIDLAELEENEWERLLDKTRFREWLVYLHKDQKRIVNEDYDRPIELRGVSGSGKTCVLAHRARRLANLYKKPVLILTLNKSLARLIENLIKDLCVEDETPPIKVEAYYEYVTRLLKTVGLKDFIETIGTTHEIDHEIQNFLGRSTPEAIDRFFAFRENSEIRQQWTNFLDQRQKSMLLTRIGKHLNRNQEGIDNSRYIFEEFELIRSAFVFDRGYQGYAQEKNFNRSGRSIPLRADQRGEYLSLLNAWEKSQFLSGRLDHMTLSQAATWALDEYGSIPDSLRYRCVLIDEHQDFSTLDLQLIRKIATEDTNGLFLTGDTGQKIYAKDFNLKKAGLGPEHRSWRAINKNYRNSREILECGHLLLKSYCNEATAKNEGVKILKPEYALRGSAKPFACKTNHSLLAAWQIAEEWLEAGNQEFSVCIATANTDVYSISEIQGHAPDSFECATLTGDYMLNTDKVITSDIQNVKGFEFSLMIIVGLEKDVFPSKGFAKKEAWRDALRLYVAITRARDEACIIYNGEPSDFLKVMQDALSEKEIFFPEAEIALWKNKRALLEPNKTNDPEPAEDVLIDLPSFDTPAPAIEPAICSPNPSLKEEQIAPDNETEIIATIDPDLVKALKPVDATPTEDEVQVLNSIPMIPVRLPATTRSLAHSLGKTHLEITRFFMWRNMHFSPNHGVPEGWIKQLLWKYRCVPRFIGEYPKKKKKNEITHQSRKRPKAKIKTNQDVSFKSTGRNRCQNVSCNNFSMHQDDYCYSCNTE